MSGPPGDARDGTALHVLFLTDNFPPETNAPASRTFEHARRWVERGHRVTVVTGCPNFPEGRPFAGYRNRWFARERIEGVDVVRVKTYMAANKGFLPRILDYLSFMVTGGIAAAVQRRPDVVVATSPQFFTAIAGRFVALVRRRPFALEIRDLWPASIVAVGAMRDSVFIRAMERIEAYLYDRADAIVVVTEAFRTEMIERGVDGAKIVCVPNGVDRDVFRPVDRDARLARELGLEGRFVAGYVGTLGMAHDLERLLEAAESLREHPRIRFVVMGAGAMRERLGRIVAERGLDNVLLMAPRPREEIPRWLGLCDLTIVPLRDDPVFAGVIPSKLFEAFACAVPVVMALPRGEATAIVERSGAGVVVPPSDPRALADAVEALAADPEALSGMATAAREESVSWSRAARANEMLEVLRALAAPLALAERGRHRS